MGPSGPVTLAVLVCLFAAAAVSLVRLRRLPLQIASGVLAFAAAAAFGVSGVNAYYDYYRSWGDVFADVAADNGRPALAVTLPTPAASPGLGAPLDVPVPGANPGLKADGRPWRLERLAFPGPLSGVTGRTALVILPPQLTAPLPVLELLHGEPGGPDSWIGGLRLAAVLQQEAAAGQVQPMVVVLPDVQGFHDQQCLDPVRGPHLSSYLRRDIPNDIRALLPVAPPGPRWLIGGLSEGGYCAADLVLHEPTLYAGAAILDGYFHPVVSRTVLGRVFGWDRGRVAAEDPTVMLRSWPATRPLPRFWLMAGTANANDYGRAVAFGRLAAVREQVRLLTVLGGRHTTPAWRVALPDLLHWASAVLSGRPYTGSLAIGLGRPVG